MAGHAKVAGEASIRTAENLRRIRKQQKLSYAELSRRLREAGHPIGDTGLLKIEKGERRVDVDDLVGLAEALGMDPSVLLGSAPCETCYGEPPWGFTCGTCGEQG